MFGVGCSTGVTLVFLSISHCWTHAVFCETEILSLRGSNSFSYCNRKGMVNCKPGAVIVFFLSGFSELLRVGTLASVPCTLASLLSAVLPLPFWVPGEFYRGRAFLPI